MGRDWNHEKSDYNIYLAFHQPNLRKTGVEHERWVIIAATRAQFPFLAVIFVFILLFLFLVFFTLDGAAIGVGFYSNFASTFRTTLFAANLKWITRNLRFSSYTVNSISPQNRVLRHFQFAQRFYLNTIYCEKFYESIWCRLEKHKITH